MKQSRLMSLVESVANFFVGYGVAVVTQILIFPIFGLHTTLAQNLKMGSIFTGVSLLRSFNLRRLIEAIRVRNSSSRRKTSNPLATRALFPYDHFAERVEQDGRQTGALGRRLWRAIRR